MRHRLAAPALAAALGAALAGCATTAPMRTVERVDVPRFMGDWYVLGAIPAKAERNAYNAVETYRLRPGTSDVVETTYVFREGAFDGELVTLRPTGFVERDGGGARWGMKFAWWQGPFRLEYLVAWLDPDYTRTIIARSARDYVWIMARTPTIPEAIRIWFTIFVCWPAPGPPWRTTVFPITSNSGRTRSTAASSPPTMIDRVALRAPTSPPETGASIASTPRARAAS